jgi:hypothetical protein
LHHAHAAANEAVVPSSVKLGAPPGKEDLECRSVLQQHHSFCGNRLLGDAMAFQQVSGTNPDVQ